MLTSTKSIKHFLDEHGEQYPYNEIRRTRQGLHAKWLITKCRNHGVFLQNNNYFVMRAGTVDFRTMQDLISSKQAVPVTPTYTEIIDCMEYWGRAIDSRWYEDVVKRIYRSNETIERNDRFHAFFDCVSLRVEDILYHRLFNEDQHRYNCYFQFRLFFETSYGPGCSFFDIAVKSFQFIDSELVRLGFPGIFV